MEYLVSRDDKTFGPYDEAELRAYIASGNIVESDRVRAADTDKWVPVKKFLLQLDNKKKKIKLDMTGLRRHVTAPPDIPWWLALILDILTGFTFFVAWDVVEGFWMHRVQPKSRALWYFLAAGALFAINAPAIYSSVLHNIFGTPATASSNAQWFGLTSFVVRIFARFSLRRSLCEHFNTTEPIGLRLSWWMTLLFGGLYFQYYFNKINEARRTMAAAATT
jgi:hypothetical protein